MSSQASPGLIGAFVLDWIDQELAQLFHTLLYFCFCSKLALGFLALCAVRFRLDRFLQFGCQPDRYEC